MKKHLILLPLLSGLVLGACDLDLGFIKFGPSEENKQEEKKEESLELPENFKMEIDGYKMATSVKNGGRYILGVYRHNENLMRFADGNYHSDAKGQYSFYFGTSTNVAEAAEVEVKFVSDDEFTMQLFAPGKPWDQKYVGVYGATSSYSNKVMSIAPLDNTKQTSFTVVNKTTTSTVSANCGTRFKFYETYEDMNAYAPGCMYLQEDVDEEAVPKFIGTGHNANVDNGEADYISMDCASYQKALDLEAYDLAHLYEKK